MGNRSNDQQSEEKDPVVLGYGSLDQSRRTISGLIGQMLNVGFSHHEIAAVFLNAGLPAEVIDDPEFSVSAAYELTLLTRVLDRLKQTRQNVVRHTISVLGDLHINQIGFFGLTLQHAPTLLEVVQEILRCPELVWGHSRILITRVNNRVKLTFDMANTPSDLEPHTRAALVEYCVLRDATFTAKILSQVGSKTAHPSRVYLACSAPPGRFNAASRLGCPVEFDAEECTLEYDYDVMQIPPVHANEFSFKRYKRMLERFVEGLADDKTIVDRVREILWAYTPPPNRIEVAGMLGLGDRTLARRLAHEGTSFHEIQAAVNTQRATNFLSYTSMSIAEVAYRMGYAEPAAFTRAFRSWVGLTPSKWRAEHASK